MAPPTEPIAPRSRITPLAPGRYELESTLDEGTVECLKRAKGLLAHVMPGADYAEVLKRVLQDWVIARERQKHGLTDKPRARTSKANGRHIPRQVLREVVQRDGRQCTIVDRNGQRCEAREQLEYDHMKPVARGGKSTTDNLRLRCRTHNQLEADRTYGAGFMRKKREGHVAECHHRGERPGSIYPVITRPLAHRPAAGAPVAARAPQTCTPGTESGTSVKTLTPGAVPGADAMELDGEQPCRGRSTARERRSARRPG